ncbi:hypothetical protein ACLRGI_03630 [Paenarthrobacter nitroguajacolicus]
MSEESRSSHEAVIEVSVGPALLPSNSDSYHLALRDYGLDMSV